MSRLAIHLLGPPRIELGGKPVQIRRRKVAALLAYLAVTGTPHSRDALATLLWPENSQSRARAYLRRELSDLNRILGGGFLTIDRETVGLRRAQPIRGRAPADGGRAPADGAAWPLWLDVHEFRERLAACTAHDHTATEDCTDCLAVLEEAVTLYRDDFMAGFTLRDCPAFDEWQFFQAEGMRNQLASALERLATWYGEQDDHEPAIGYARRWVALDPTNEHPHRQLMRLYAQAGRRGAALRQYRTCVRTLEEELDVEPAGETRALYERLQAERATPVETPHIPPTAPPVSLPRFLSDAEGPFTSERPLFVKREPELARLTAFLELALAGQGQVAFVFGGPGRGKTTLLREFARRAQVAHPELIVATGSGKSYTGRGDPFLPFRELLALLTGDVDVQWSAGIVSTEAARRLWHILPTTLNALLDRGPHLINSLVRGPALLRRARAYLPEGSSGARAWRERLQELEVLATATPVDPRLPQSALFRQYSRVLGAVASERPLLLLLDDLQWADRGSIGLLFHLGQELAGQRTLILGAYRPEEILLDWDGASSAKLPGTSAQRERHPLESVLVEFRRRFGDVWVDLARTDAVEGRGFVDAILDRETNHLAEDFRAALFQRSGGHPLFTAELLRDMRERGDVVRDAQGSWVAGPTLEWQRLPAQVEAVIEARVGRLDEQLREILTVASVEGEAFTAQVIARVLDLPERALLRALSHELGSGGHRLVREGSEVQLAEAGRFLNRHRFAHALFQEHLYRTLSVGERRLLHGEVGEALELLRCDGESEIAPELAFHFAKAGHREKAAKYALLAGDGARRTYANAQAIPYYQQVLELLGTEPAIKEREKSWQLAALRGLGQVHFLTGQIVEAEPYLREAIRLGEQMGLAPSEMARLYFWLGDVLFWQDQPEKTVELGETALALLDGEVADADGIESTEGAMILGMLANSQAHADGSDVERLDQLYQSIAKFIQRVPYVTELRPAYAGLAGWNSWIKAPEEAVKWLQAFEMRARTHNDLRGLGDAQLLFGAYLDDVGDIQGAKTRGRQALELGVRIGDLLDEGGGLAIMSGAAMRTGSFQQAESYTPRILEIVEAIQAKLGLGGAHLLSGHISLGLHSWEKAEEAFRKAIYCWEEIGRQTEQALATGCLGIVFLAQGKRNEAVGWFQDAVAVAGPFIRFRWELGSGKGVCLLSVLEEAYADPEVFRAFCRSFRAQHPEFEDVAFVNWYLEPVVSGELPGTHGQAPIYQSAFAESLSPDWVWEDPFDDCAFKTQNGLTICAANGRDLWHINLSAPRLLRPAPGAGEWITQTVCSTVSAPAAEGKKPAPAIGGLLLWKDNANYLRLDRGRWGAREISFGGCVENEDLLVGRGKLHAGDSSGRVFLRLEAIDGRVRALCSADGEQWFSVGSIAFPVEDGDQIGLHAIGEIDRTIYRGAYPDGTGIRFESFTLWGLDD